MVEQLVPRARRGAGRPRPGRDRQDVRAGRRPGGMAGRRRPGPRLRAVGSSRLRAARSGRDRRDHDRPPTHAPRRRRTASRTDSVLIVDEAGMVGTRDLAASPRPPSQRRPSSCSSATTASSRRSRPAARSARSADACGRPSSCARSAARTRPGTARRSTRCATASVERWADAYADHGRVVTAPRHRHCARAAGQRLVAGRATAATRCMIAHRRADVADLNQRARAAHARRPASLGARRARARRPRLRRRRPRRRRAATTGALGVLNGQRGTVLAATAERATLDVQLDNGERSSSSRSTTSRPGTSTTATRSPPTAPRARPSTGPSSSAATSSTASGATPRSAATATRPASTSARARSSSTSPPRRSPRQTDVSSAVFDKLLDSRIKQLAVGKADRHRAERLEHADEQVKEAEARQARLAEQLEDTGWHRFGARSELRDRSEQAAKQTERLRERRDTLHEQHAKPTLSKALDPLGGLTPEAPGLHPEMPGPADLDRGTGLDLGM